MLSLARGRYVARIAETEADVRRAQRLRWLAFIAGRGLDRTGDGDGTGTEETGAGPARKRRAPMPTASTRCAGTSWSRRSGPAPWSAAFG